MRIELITLVTLADFSHRWKPGRAGICGVRGFHTGERSCCDARSGYDLGVTLRPARILSLYVALALMTVPVTAHHSFAGEFDVSHAVTLRGVVARVEFLNPHSHVYLDVQAGSGKVERWAIEGPSIANIRRSEWNKQPVKTGDVIAVCGYAAINNAAKGTRRLSAAVLTMADGEKRLWENNRVGKCELDR
jgi:hypothetical protein